jgi:hypothetical protein
MTEEGETRPPLPTRKLRVTDYKKIGQTQKGAPIYKVTAVHEDGSPVEKDGEPIELRAFQELPVGEVVEYGMKKYVHERYGDSYTLYPPKEKLGRRVDALESQIAELQQRVADLETGNVGGGGIEATDIAY